MQIISARNVNEAYWHGCRYLSLYGDESDSRAGGVLVAPTPVVTVYERPVERVLFSAARDANPFFHLFESLWMLSGRQDATWLDRFVSDFSSRFAEDDGNQWGAYGHRWRRHFDIDQLSAVVERLRRSPEDRRVVISMWDSRIDLWDPRDQESMDSPVPEPRDLPCNTHLYPRVRDGVLDLTICCRSNDIVWGAYGANAVHFSVLQEYLAGMVGCGVGTMYQLSNNYHAYTEVFDKRRDSGTSFRDSYALGRVATEPMASDWSAFDEDLSEFMSEPAQSDAYVNDWFSHVARPMWIAHDIWQNGDREGALYHAGFIGANDWRVAVTNWMERRMGK